MKTYTFNEQQVRSMLLGYVEMVDEYTKQHGKTKLEALELAIAEVFDGLKSEQYLLDKEILPKATMQLYPQTKE